MARRFNPDCSDRALFLVAARTIELEAHLLRRSHSCHGRWSLLDPIDIGAKESHDEYMRIASELRARARYAE